MRKMLTRRETLGWLVATPLLGGALGACGKSEPDKCDDLSTLSEGEKTARAALQYTDRSMQNDKRCDLCSYFKVGPDPASCGSCTLVKGPIHPKGYCTAFSSKT